MTTYINSFKSDSLWSSKEELKAFAKKHIAAVGSNADRQIRFVVEAILYFYGDGDKGNWIINLALEAAYVGGLKPKALIAWLAPIMPHKTTDKSYEVRVQTGPNKGNTRKILGKTFAGKKQGEDYPCMEDVQAWIEENPSYLEFEQTKKEQSDQKGVEDLLKSLKQAGEGEKWSAEAQRFAKLAISTILQQQTEEKVAAHHAAIEQAAEALLKSRKRKAVTTRKRKSKATVATVAPELDPRIEEALEA